MKLLRERSEHFCSSETTTYGHPREILHASTAIPDHGELRHIQCKQYDGVVFDSDGAALPRVGKTVT